MALKDSEIIAERMIFSESLGVDSNTFRQSLLMELKDVLQRFSAAMNNDSGGVIGVELFNTVIGYLLER